MFLNSVFIFLNSRLKRCSRCTLTSNLNSIKQLVWKGVSQRVSFSHIEEIATFTRPDLAITTSLVRWSTQCMYDPNRADYNIFPSSYKIAPMAGMIWMYIIYYPIIEIVPWCYLEIFVTDGALAHIYQHWDMQLSLLFSTFQIFHPHRMPSSLVKSQSKCTAGSIP